MLDEKDLLAIANLIDSRAKKTETLLLDEIARTQNHLEKKVELVQKNINELNQYHRISKLENENTTLLLQMIQDLKKEGDELKKKIA